MTTGLSALITHNKKIPNSKNITLAIFALTAPLILIGAIADKMTNKDRQKAADLVADVGTEQAKLIDKELEVSKKGNLYKPTAYATGFALLWGLGSIAISGLSHLLFKKGVVKNEIFKQLGLISKFFKYVAAGGSGTEFDIFMSMLPVIPPMIPLVGSDWLNKLQAKRNS